MSRSTDQSKIELNKNKSTDTDNTKVNKNDKDPNKKDDEHRRHERSPGQQEFIENRQKHLQMRKAIIISKMQQKRNLSFRNNIGKSFAQRRIRQFPPKQTKSGGVRVTTAFSHSANQNASSENFHKLNKPLSITEKFIHRTKYEIAELELAIKEGRSLTPDEKPINDAGKSSQILEMEQELMAERERIHFLKLQVEADLNRETENAAKIAHENANVELNLLRTPSRHSRGSRSPKFRNDQRQLNIGQGFRKNVQTRRRFSRSMGNSQNQIRRQPQYQHGFEKDNSPLNHHKDKRVDHLEDDDNNDYNKRPPSRYNEKVLNPFQNRDIRDGNNASKSFPRNFHDTNDGQQLSVQSPSSNRRLDRDNNYTTKSTQDGYRSSVSVERQIVKKANVSTTPRSINHRLSSTTYSKEDEMEMKFTGGGIFDKHILHIQNEFVDRFGLLQQSPMETDRHEDKYIENKKYDLSEYNDNSQFTTVARNRTQENRYSSRHQQYTTDANKHRFEDDLPDWNQEVNYPGRKMSKDFDTQHHRSNYLDHEDGGRDNEQKLESDIDYNTNFREELTDESYIRRSRSNERNWPTERNNRPYYNPFTTNKNDTDDETFYRKKSTDRSNNRYHHSSAHISDSRSVDIIHHQKPATTTGFKELSGKNVHIADYRSRQNRHIINDDDDDDRFTQRSNRDQYSTGNNNKINEFFNDHNQNTDARQYIIKKEMQKFNERTRSSAHRSSNSNFASKRINDRHEHSAVSSNWSNKNRNDFSLSFDEFESNSMHSDVEIDDRKFTANKDNNDEVNRGRRLSASRREQCYHNDDKRSHMEKFNERRQFDQSTNQQRYNRNRNQHCGEKAKNQFNNNDGRGHDRQRFLSHKRNNSGGRTNNDSRIVTMQQKRNSYFDGNH